MDTYTYYSYIYMLIINILFYIAGAITLTALFIVHPFQFGYSLQDAVW